MNLPTNQYQSVDSITLLLFVSSLTIDIIGPTSTFQPLSVFPMKSILRWIVLMILSCVSIAWTNRRSFRTNNINNRQILSLCSPRSSILIRELSKSYIDSNDDNNNDNNEDLFYQQLNVTILDRGQHHVVVDKPAGVVCHHSDWSGSRIKSKRKRGLEPEYPMLQRVREAVGERVNLIFRLDRGASGCLLLSFAKSDEGDGNATAVLQDAMQSSTTSKTYLAMVRGEGILHGRDFRNEGWFEVDRPLKDESGNLKNATTYFRFIAGQDNGNGTINDRPRVSLVLARIKTGRWHQIRKHLNGISHPIIGDSTHGNSKTNREWKEKWGLQPERTCLHLLQLKIPSTSVTPSGISIISSLPSDMEKMLKQHLEPETLRIAESALAEEGLSLQTLNESIEEPIKVKISLK